MRSPVAALLVIGPCLVIFACRDPHPGAIPPGTGASEEGKDDLSLIVSHRNEIPSQLPWKYADYLDPDNRECVLDKNDVVRDSFMAWTFYGGRLIPRETTLQSIMVLFAIKPEHIRPMMPELKDSSAELMRALKENRRGCLVGHEELARKKKSIGDRITITSTTHEGIDLELEIVGELPHGRYDFSAFMNVDYLKDALHQYERANGRRHSKAELSLNLILFQARDSAAAERIKKAIEGSTLLADPPLRCQKRSEAAADVNGGQSEERD